MLRAFIIAMRYGAEKAFYYNVRDDKGAFPFDNCGLLTEKGNKKASAKLLEKVITKYGDYMFQSAVLDGENGEYAYVFDDYEGNEVVFSWTKDSKTISITE